MQSVPKEEGAVFYFSFLQDEGGEELQKTLYGFFIPERSLKSLFNKLAVSNFDDFSENFYDNFTRKIEEDFGVHDWSTSPVPGVNAVGYTTYEVEKERVIPLMQRWKEALEKKSGEKVGDIHEIPEGIQKNDKDIYDFLKVRL